MNESTGAQIYCEYLDRCGGTLQRHLAADFFFFFFFSPFLLQSNNLLGLRYVMIGSIMAWPRGSGLSPFQAPFTFHYFVPVLLLPSVLLAFSLCSDRRCQACLKKNVHVFLFCRFPPSLIPMLLLYLLPNFWHRYINVGIESNRQESTFGVP